jgi:tetratricopeptide (TPR) repeat protein
MKKIIISFLTLSIFLLLFSSIVTASDYLTQADAIYQKDNLESVKQALPLYQKAVEENPDSYEANWKMARILREYADLSMQAEVSDWKDICKKYGKEGLKFAETAKKMEPDKVEGNYYYGLCAGTYSDGISILKAIREGLRRKTEKAFEKAYDLDKMYDDAGPILALARMWHQLPWPYQKEKTSQRYFEEYSQYFPDNPQGLVYYAELLKDRGKKKEAIGLLNEAAQSDHPYFSKRAKELLEKWSK